MKILANVVSQRTLVALVTGLSFVQVTLAQPIPDEIDFRKYEKIYLTSMAQSDQKRAEANAHLANAQNVDNQIATVSNQLSLNEQEILRLQSVIASFTQQIEDLYRVNDQLTIEKNQLAYRINQNTNQMNQLSGHINQLDHQIQVLDNQIDVLSGKIAQLDSQIAQLQNQKQAQQQTLNSLVQQKSQTEQQITNLSNQRAQLQSQIQQIQAQIPQLQSQISQLQNQVSTLEGQVNSLTAQVQSAQAELQGAQANQANAQQQVNAVQAALQAAQNELQTVRQNIQRVTTNMAETEQQIRQTNKELEQAKANGDKGLVEKLEAQLAQLQQKLGSLKQRLAEFQQQQSELTQQIAVVQSQLNQAQQALNQANAQVQAKQQSLNQAQAQLQQAQSSLNQARTQLQQKQQQLAQLQNSLPTLQSQLANVQNQLVERQNQLIALNNQIAQVQQAMAQLQNQIDVLIAKRNPWANELQNLANLLHNKKQNRKELVQQYNALANDSQWCENRIRDIDTQVSLNLHTIQSCQNEAQNAYAQIQGIQQSNTQLKTYLVQLQSQAQAAWALYQQADTMARRYEARTLTDYNKYAAVKANYDRLYAEATEAGAAQGHPLGNSEGHDTGSQVGEVSGVNEGNQLGEREAGLSSYESGLTQGLTQGKDNGYKAGSTAPQHYQKGFDLGYAAGKKQAQDEAQATSYVQGRSDRKKLLLSSLPTNVVDLDNGAKPEGGIHHLSIPKNGPQANLGSIDPDLGLIAPLSQTSVDTLKIEDPDLKVKQMIALTQAERANLVKTLEELRKTKAYPGNVSIDSARANCKQNYVDFVEACKAGFVAQYKASYVAQYGDSYLDARNQSFDVSFPEALNKHKDSRLKEGFDAAYPIVYAKWEAIGAEDAQNKGFTEGKDKGYKDTIAPAKAEAYARGQADETQYFDTNGVSRLLSAGVDAIDAAKGFIPGAPIVLKLTAANFGKKATLKDGVKLTVQPLTNNVGFEKATTGLLSLPANSQARVANVLVGRVSPEAGWEEEVRIRVRAQHPDGLIEDHVVTFKTKFSLDVAVKLDTNLKPDIKSLFGFKSHEIAVNMTLNSRNVKQRGFKIVAVQPAGLPDVKFDVKEGSVGAIDKGQSAKVILKYEIRNKKYEGKQIPLEVVILYDDTLEVARAKVVVTAVN